MLRPIAVAAAALALAGAAQAAAPAPLRAELAASGTCTAGERKPLGTTSLAFAAVARHKLNAFRSPGRGLLHRFAVRNVNGVETVLGIVGAETDGGCSPRWYRVLLPLRPNGSTGWVRAEDVTVLPVYTRIDVDLSAHRVTFFRSGRPVLTTPAAIGTSATPTPTGRFYVNQRLVPSSPGGPFGPGAIGISGFSPVLTGWAQGGPVAIHGTNRPWLIGRSVSNGCIRVPNAVIRRVFRSTADGTPVVIHA